MKSFSKKEPKYKTNYEKKILKSVKNNIKRIKIFKKIKLCIYYLFIQTPQTELRWDWYLVKQA